MLILHIVRFPVMFRLKIIVSFLFLCLVFTEGNAQVTSIDSLPGSATIPIYHHKPVLHMLDVSIRTGTEFMTTSGYGSGLSTFLSPTLSYPVSRKFSISGGLSVIHTTLYGIKTWSPLPEENSSTVSGNLMQATLWFSGQYILNDHLTLTGTLFKTFDLMENIPGYSRLYGASPQGGYLNLGYRINDHMHIEAGFGYSRGYNGYNWGYNAFPGYFGR